MTTINLDAARAARREAGQRGPVVQLDGEEFVLPVELPIAVANEFMLMTTLEADDPSAVTAVLGVVKSLFGDKYEDFMKRGPSVEDLRYLLEHRVGSITDGCPQDLVADQASSGEVGLSSFA
jgi:hypothetical protein